MKRALLSLVAVMLLAGAAGTTGEGEAARAFLTATFGVTRGELDRLDAGQVVSRTMEARDSREVATFGVVRVGITPEFYVERLSDVATLKKDEAILQIGTFRQPPTQRDVADLTLDDADIDSLRDCRPGDCGVQLSADAITRFGREVDWRSPAAAGQANGLMRQVLVEYVAAYQQGGAAASMEYADERKLLQMGPEFAALVQTDLGGWQVFPGLKRHLLEYPASRERTHDLIYWSKEKVARRGVVSVTHLAIWRTAGDSPADYAIASKQIYGSHYYDASLGLTVLVPVRPSPTTSMYLVYVNRSRIDMFDGMFGGVVRRIVSSKARSTVSDNLAQVRRTLELQFAARSSD